MMTELTCRKHPRYEVKAKPRSMCPDCWAMWEAKVVADAEAEMERRRLEAEENEVSTMRYHPATDAALKELAWNIATDRIFTNRHCLSSMEVSMAFPVLFMMKLCDRKWLLNNPPGLIWEAYEKASPRGVNGLPMFFSAHFLSPEDLPKMEVHLKKALEARKHFVDVDQLGPVDIE